jgi:hypothetical protein
VLSRPVEVSAGRLDVLHTASRGDNDSLRRLGQKSYQVLSTHRRAEVGGNRWSAGYRSLGSGVEGEE